MRLAAEPELCDAGGLVAAVQAAVEEGCRVFSFEEPGRFPLPEALAGEVALEFPTATRLWQAWRMTNEESRRKWAAEIPQPLYLKPPHITPAKRPWLVRPA